MIMDQMDEDSHPVDRIAKTFCYVLFASYPLSMDTGLEREVLIRNAGISVGGEGVVLTGVGRGRCGWSLWLRFE